MSAFLKFLIWFVAALVIATFQYAGGRILIPETGLTPPGWWAWFWFTYLIELPLATITSFWREAGKTTASYF